MNYEKYLAGNKVITLADRKFIEKHIISLDELETVVINPISKVKVDANPLICALVKMVQELSGSDFAYWARSKWIVTKGGAVQDFDRAKLIILKLDRYVYSELID